ncbi:MAG: anthranilate synthase component I [Verrucomicrobiales bacterium]|nr:anthranilate synthase component I [Verrucomicrobiales bacterium]MED5585117.1 anthranilate synthase component I [Verrucomicrobiota bacterium]
MPDFPLQPNFEEFKARVSRGNLIPVYAEMTADYETPLSAFHKISDGRNCFLLESAESSESVGRYSFVGSGPRAVIEARGTVVKVTEEGESREFDSSSGDPLKDLEEFMAKYKPVSDPGLPLFYGGAVGYLSYDSVRYFEPGIPAPPPDQLGLPDMIFMVTDTVVIFDHRLRKLLIVANVMTGGDEDADALYEAARRIIKETAKRLTSTAAFQPLVGGIPTPPAELISNTTRQEYCDMVERAKEYINAGDVFQIVPSQRFEVDYDGQPIDLYRALRAVNPSPYMFCLQFEEGFSLVGCSPEVHVRAIDGRIDIRPIAGTRWRGETPEEDDALAKDLLSDPKERAEHIMLVDLARNDVGRVSEYESVKVEDFMIVERYSHVMHIVSNVTGRLAPGKNSYDVMRATFPAGTVSGAPKIRAMEIINELEKSKRCAYSGAVGYFGFDGNHDSCIALRTAVLKDGKAYVQAGAGVVADSDPDYEFNETVNKAMGLVKGIERAGCLGIEE